VKSLSDIGEDRLIERLIALVPRPADPNAGPGDDCAVIDPGPQFPTLLLLKTDALVARIHYRPDAPPRAVGWKAVARVISDFAAMGGRPEHFLVTLALPETTEIAWVEELYRGMGDALIKFGAVLAGGETSRVPAGSAAVISIAATGSVARENLVLRSTGQQGDILLVTGSLGGSIQGKHLNFTPRLAEAAWLVSHHKPTAMMDLSDGLGKDLPRLALASGCGFLLDQAALPLTPGCTTTNAIADGEDFELLLAIKPDRVASLLADWALAFPMLPLSAIGQLAAPEASQVLEGGWDHFSEPLPG
jgi:thiamine-monophosphate kinase